MTSWVVLLNKLQQKTVTYISVIKIYGLKKEVDGKLKNVGGVLSCQGI